MDEGLIMILQLQILILILQIVILILIQRRGYARDGREHRSKLLMATVFCSVVVWTAYTQTGLFTAQTTVQLLRDVYLPGFENSIPDFCVENGMNVTVLIVVVSAPNHNYHRMAIRKTWASFSRYKDYRVAFIVGSHPDPVVMRQLTEEGAIYNDVIISRNTDSYQNLVLKTASVFEWASTFCRNASYILKTDDHVFVNVPKLKEFIKSLPKSENNIYGHLVVKDNPVRNFTSKYYVSEEEFSGPVFPDYVSGGGYLMTVEVATVLYEAALNSTFFNMEDAFFTGVVAQSVGVGRVAMPGIRRFTSELEPSEVGNTIIFQKVMVLNHDYIFYVLRNY